MSSAPPDLSRFVPSRYVPSIWARHPRVDHAGRWSRGKLVVAKRQLREEAAVRHRSRTVSCCALPMSHVLSSLVSPLPFVCATAHATFCTRQAATECRAEQRQRARKLAAEAATAAAAARAAALELTRAPAECVACRAAPACMLSLPCRHMALCRRCWEESPRVGEACALCGARCALSLCVHRP